MPRYFTSLAKTNIFRRTRVNFLIHAHLSHLWQIISILAFVTNHPIYRQLLMVLYLAILWLDNYCWTSLKDTLPNIYLVFYIHTITFAGGQVRQFIQIIGKWNVAVILILPSNNTIRTLPSCIIIQIVTHVE